jgi:hypothetical protein
VEEVRRARLTVLAVVALLNHTLGFAVIFTFAIAAPRTIRPPAPAEPMHHENVVLEVLAVAEATAKAVSGFVSRMLADAFGKIHEQP